MKKTALLILSFIILCTACAAQAAGEWLPVFASIREAIDSTDGCAVIRDTDDYSLLLLELEGRYFRIVTLLDDHAKDLHKAAEAEPEGSRTPALEVFDEYAWALPVSYTEELPDKPKSQADLDALKGKTVQELQDNGFGIMILTGDISEIPDVIALDCGFYRYAFEVTNGESGYPQYMTIKSGKFDGFSYDALDIDYHP